MLILLSVALVASWFAGHDSATLAASPEPIGAEQFRAWLTEATQAGKVAVIELQVLGQEIPTPPETWDDPEVQQRLAQGMIEVRTLRLNRGADARLILPHVVPHRRLDSTAIDGPGLYAFRDLELVAVRLVAIDGASLGGFLDEVAAAESMLDERRREVDRGRGDLIARIDASKPLITDLVNRGLFVEAVERVDALWRDPSPLFRDYAESVHAKLRIPITVLISHSDHARIHFSDLRDAVEGRLRAGDASRLDLHDWALLTAALGDMDRIVAWVERVGDAPETVRLLNDPGLDLFGSLIDASEWEVAGRTILYPLQRAQALTVSVQMLPGRDALSRDEIDSLESRVRVEIAELYAACLAADRPIEAERIVAMLQAGESLDPILKIALAHAAADAGVSQPVHLDWLDEAEREGIVPPDGLRERVSASLDQKVVEKK